jgi:LPS O-antigen subunit length determinant protein (WzzB/FepE family)
MSNTPKESESQSRQSPQVSHERLVYVMPERSNLAYRNDEVDLRELLGILWRGRLIIIAVTAMFAVSSVAYALLQVEWYRAEVLLAPTDEDAGPVLGGQLGGLVALAGVNAGGSKSVDALAVLKSREFARGFIEELALLPVFFADKWDSTRETWLSSSPDEWPDVRDAIRYFHDNVLQVSEDRNTGLVTMAVEWTDAQTAADWAATLVRRLNARMRQQALQEAEANVAYLREELAATNVVALQQSIGRLLESEMQKLMLARRSEEFAFRVIDSPQVPKYRVRPRRMMILAIGTLLGGIIGSFIVLVASVSRAEVNPLS